MSDPQAKVSNHLSNALPQREREDRRQRVRSATSFVSCPSTPVQSVSTNKRAERNIESYFRPIVSDNMGASSDAPGKSVARTLGPSPGNERSVTPNIVDDYLADEGATVPLPVMTSSDHDGDNRGTKRRRNTSKPTNNYEIMVNGVAPQGKLDPNMPSEPQPLDDMSKELFAESGRPAITITSQVSDNRSKTQNPLSVSFQVPARAEDMAQAGPSGPPESNRPQRKEVENPGMPWMGQLELDYFTTARSSVVAEARANIRSQMLNDISSEGLIAPWALNLAPMPVYMHPHATQVAALMREQAIVFQQKCAAILQKNATFQAERVVVDKASLKNIFDRNEAGYKDAIGAIFDARLRVQIEVREQMTKQRNKLADSANQVSEKDLTSMVKGVVPTRYAYADVRNINRDDHGVTSESSDTQDDREDNPRGRKRSQSRDRRSRSRSRPRKVRSRGRPQTRGNDRGRRGYGYGYNNNYDRDQHNYQMEANRDNRNFGGARPRQQNWYYNERPRQASYPPPTAAIGRPGEPQDDSRYLTPDVIQRIAQAYGNLQK